MTDNVKVQQNKKFQVTEVEAKDAPVKDVHWHGQEVEAKAKLFDPFDGTPLVVKFFEFHLPPVDSASKLPGKKDLLDFHRKKIQAFLWKDDLVLREDVKPLKFVAMKKENKFLIVAVCSFKKGMIVPRRVRENLKPIHELVAPRHSN